MRNEAGKIWRARGFAMDGNGCDGAERGRNSRVWNDARTNLCKVVRLAVVEDGHNSGIIFEHTFKFLLQMELRSGTMDWQG